ncbi:AAA family ATPase [Lentilitoribacter sp. Alg239-R112]|uniref:AAA family ATPase n=1 Tax=Lentilitoribacter sp. Alg239-R112 TaxID=2305987 RepID=UPI0013A6BB4A|nr:AAA family ATPase [Lentilitoribacter sp. Alg239-R112]
MTMFNPNLHVTQLTIHRNGLVVFDECFHTGLNIIRGENSSGKSSIMDFIFYALGGDLGEHQWRETSLLCDRVYLGVTLNGVELTLSREIEQKIFRPMDIFFGTHEEAMSAPISEWEKFSYSRGGSKNPKESFSQVLFRLLGLPEVRIEEQNVKVTMHQILRLLYSDQLSSVERIFRDQQIDDATTKATVGDILLGAYSDKFYRATLRLREAKDELKDVVSTERRIGKEHQVDGQPLTPEWLIAEHHKLENEIQSIAGSIEKLENEIFSEQFKDRLTLNDQESTYKLVVELQSTISEITESLHVKELEISDAKDFISSMDHKIGEITDAEAVVKEFEYLAFDICPACLGVITEHEIEGACTLCKSSFNKEDTINRSARLLNEAIRQRDRSKRIQEDRIVERDDLKRKLEAERQKWEDANRYYSISLRTPTTELRSELRKLNRLSGYKHRQLEELSLKKSIVEQLHQLAESRKNLISEISDLETTIDSESNKNIERRSIARRAIENNTLKFLHGDLDRQSTFANAEKISFEFDGDRLSVNDESFFSASSMVYLRNSFLAAFHFSSVADSKFGHPRFMLMDTIEDKGMEPQRSQNFQRALAARSDDANSVHQIIIATSMIADELNNEKYVVGEYYTHENRTLNILT